MEGHTETILEIQKFITLLMKPEHALSNNPWLQTLNSLLLKQEKLRVQAQLEFKKQEQLMEVERKE